MRAQFITAEEVEQALGVSRSKAYQIIRALNKELKAITTMVAAFAPGRCTMYERTQRAISELYAMKYEVERMGGEFRGYSEAYRKKKKS